MRHDAGAGKYAGGPRQGGPRATLCVSSQVFLWLFVGVWFLFFMSHFQLQMSSRQLDVVSLPFSVYWIIRVVLADHCQSVNHTFEGTWSILFGILLNKGQLPIKCSMKRWQIICLFVAKGGVPNGLYILRYWHHGTEGQFIVWRDRRTTSSC